MQINLEQLEKNSLQKIQDLGSLTDLENARVQLLGKSGEITSLLKNLGKMSADERKTFGQGLNQVKQAVAQALENKKNTLETAELNKKLATEAQDMTLPVTPSATGRRHPISAVMEEIEDILGRLGFDPASGPEIESDYMNFTALNIPQDHPARQDHDTFYLPDGEDGRKRVLRTHTSPVQIRAMQKYGAPLRVQAIGRVYRCDSDVTHTPQFHQVEGLALDENITFAHLKGVLKTFMRMYFERDVDIRLRPSYFPFTEPSVEVDVTCLFCEGAGCRVCKNTTWLEVLGAGMVHPNVLEHGGIDAKTYQGFAFGAGIERLAMLKYGIDDLRLFFESHQAFLRHFGK